MSNNQTTDGIKPDESVEPQMSVETYRFVMGWSYYPEPATGERQVKLGLHTRMPDFSVLNFKDGVRCFPAYGPTVFEQREPSPGAGVAWTVDGKHNDEPEPSPSKPVRRERWQTQSSKALWKERAERLHRKEVKSVRKAVEPEVPHICLICKDMNPSKKACKLAGQNMASLCSLHNSHRGVIITPANKRRGKYMGSLRQKLAEFEKRNRPAKIWRVSTLPTFGRNDGKFLRYDTNEEGEPVRVYLDYDPRLVPEVAFSHDRTEDNSGYDECAFPDDWRTELGEVSGNDDHVFMDTIDESDIKRQCFEMPKPNWVSVTRRYSDPRRLIVVRTESYYIQDKRTELNKVWRWIPEQHKFMFTVEERTVVVPVRRDHVVLRAEEYPTLINVQTEEQLAREIKMQAKATGCSEHELRAENTILVQSETVITKKERRFYNARRDAERQKRRLTGYLISKDVEEGKSTAPKHRWPVRMKKNAAAPVPMEA